MSNLYNVIKYIQLIIIINTNYENVAFIYFVFKLNYL